MPFLSKDWRSPGEAWVRHEGGWELKKTVWTSQSLKRNSGKVHTLDLAVEGNAGLSVSCPQRSVRVPVAGGTMPRARKVSEDDKMVSCKAKIGYVIVVRKRQRGKGLCGFFAKKGGRSQNGQDYGRRCCVIGYVLLQSLVAEWHRRTVRHRKITFYLVSLRMRKGGRDFYMMLLHGSQ